MTCIDCGEDITEVERRGARTCVVCLRPLHQECTMVGFQESDNCERCFNLEQKGFDHAMACRGIEIDDDQKFNATRRRKRMMA